MDTTQTDDCFWDALAHWESLYQQGQDTPAEELCRDHPQNLERLKQHIHAMKRTAWLTKPITDDPAPAQPQDASDHTPKTLGEYDLLERLGTGGMGHVFKAVHRRMDRTVAIKLLPRSSLELAQRFQEEVKAAAKLVHPNIVTAYDAGEQNGIPFLVMEHIEGVDLHRYVDEHGPLPVEKATNYIVQAARGLEFAHGKGIVHRDVKPANLLIGSDGTVKILDLGLAQIRASQQTQAVGTPDFMAPELALDPSKADPRSDTYALGCTLWFLLTGKPLFERASTVIQKIVAHRDQPVPSLRKVRPDVPEALDAIFRKIVAKQPEDRFQSMAEVVAALKGLQHGPRRAWLLWIGMVAAAMMGLLLAGYNFFLRNDPGTTQDRKTDWTLSVSGKATIDPDTTQDRQAAEWALNIGGKITIALRNGRQMPVTDLASLPKTPFKVNSIDVHENSRVTDDALAVVKGLGRIADLNLYKTRISDAGTEHLKDLTSLNTLRLNDTTITDKGLRNLEGLTKLKMLELWGTQISNDALRHLYKMQDLTWLILADTKITDDGLRHLQELLNLRELRLARLKITDEGVSHLAALKELRTLEVYETQITDASLKIIASLKNLTWLNLVRTKITDAGVDDLIQMQSLRQLNLDGTQVTEVGIKRLRQALPACNITTGLKMLEQK